MPFKSIPTERAAPSPAEMPAAAARVIVNTIENERPMSGLTPTGAAGHATNRPAARTCQAGAL